MSDASDKVATIFRELVGESAERLSGSRYLADVNSRITQALAGESSSDEVVLRQDGIGFHMVDWQSEAAFIVALCLFPERFTDDEIRHGIDAFLIHAPHHILEAARLGGYPTENIFLEEDEENKSEQAGAANPHAFGTSGISPAEQARMPEASGDT